jgi:penicillin-binding protein 1C
MEGVSGITGAGPLFRAVMEAAMRGRTVEPFGVGASRRDDAEDGLVRVEICPLSGGARGPACPHGVHEWVPGTRRPEACRMHEKVAVDRRNGLRAGPGCGAADVRMRTFERFDPAYVAWARAAQRDTAPEEDSPLCPGAGGARRGEEAALALRVAYPRDGARFVIDPDRPRAQQTLPIRALAPAGTPIVSVVIDGRPAGAVRAPYVARWTLARGDHVVVADAPGLGPSVPVHVRVD